MGAVGVVIDQIEASSVATLSPRVNLGA